MKRIIRILLVLFPLAVIGQTQTENYTKKTTYKIPTTVKIASPTISEAIQNITYFDGLGRPKQQIDNAQSPLGKDIVTPIEYDGFGRQEKDYLPYVPVAGASLNYKTNALTELGTFYNVPSYENTTNPYSQKEFEASPLNRITKQAAPGQDWKLGNGHEVRFEYQTNTASDKVRRFRVSFIEGNSENPYLEDQGVYAPSQLYKTITKDEDWVPNQLYPYCPNDHAVHEFKDKQGRIVLKRTFDANKWHDTYYVYDDYGNLTYVLPPKTNTYTNLAEQFKNQEIFLDSYVDGINFFTNDIYYTEISMFESNGKLECFLYADNVFEDYLKSGKIADLNFTTPLPDMVLGDIMMNTSKEEIVVAGTVYIRDGDLYFDSTGTKVNADRDSNATYAHFSIDLSDYQNDFTVPSLERETFNDLIYQYKYDKRNRLIEKKLPGKDWEYIVYDKLDRPVLTQDANLRADKKWLFTKYDVFGRLTYTGMHTNTVYLTRADMQNYFDSQNNTGDKMYESKVATGTGYDNSYYSNSNFPNTSIEIYTINYYDNYNFDTNGSILNNVSVNTRGLITGNKNKILGTANWITSVNGYDEKGRVIYGYSKNDYLATVNTVTTDLNFIGQTLKNTTTHLRNGISTTIVDVFTYDHAGRPAKHTQAINGSLTPEVISDNSYDELGKLIQKKVGGKTTQNPLQTVDYTYNIRGWLKGINDTDSNNYGITLGLGDLFGFQINYNKPSYPGKALYNGNISQTYWKIDADLKSYTYKYDALNRLKKSNYFKNNDYESSQFNETIKNYDRNGNILGLYRYMEAPYNASRSTLIDDLAYTHDKGNKLLKVDETYKVGYAYGGEGFKDGTNTDADYSYDNNGNMLLDKNKGITSITYNHLNLPLKVTFANGTIDYIYDATGAKQRKIVNPGLVTDYAGGFQYENNTLKFFTQPEGFVEYNSGNFNYIYQYKDHLGNVRLSYRDANGDGTIAMTEILEKNDYYPLGLKHKNNSVANSTTSALKYKYNGKELQDELGLNMYDYGARNYDPALGRWMNIDPLAEISRRWSPYNYAYNNPVYFVDPDGMMADDWKTDSNGNMVYDPNLTKENASTQLGIGEKYVGKSAFQDNGNGTSTIYNEGGSKDVAVNLSNVTINPERSSYVSSGAYGPYMGPDAMSVSYSVSVNGLFFSANLSVGLAFTGNDAAALFSGGINWGPQSDLGWPGIKGGWSIAAHNNEGTSNDVLAGLGGDSIGYFGGAVIGGAISQSATKKGKVDPNGVSNISVNLGPTIGLGKTKSSGYSFKASDGINYLKSQF